MKINTKKSKSLSYFRKVVDDMDGYTPGEQPQRVGGWIKLNTNENPYPPSPAVAKLTSKVDSASLRLYPDPACCELRKTVASLNGLRRDNVIIGNGSDDILTIAIRCFVSEDEFVACPEPSYSLYPVLSHIQGADCCKIQLNKDFSLPDDFAEQAKEAKLLLIPRPNAPTGTAFEMKKMRAICNNFDGIVLIDEAYADFADDSCVKLIDKFPNVIVSRTFSKSYSLAGIRVGYAMASHRIIAGMMKVKDSYNVNVLSQKIALAALKDQDYFKNNIEKICETRKRLSTSLIEAGFEVIPSQANFIFVSPSDGNGEKLYLDLKEKGILVRWFAGKVTGRYIRITIGTNEETDKLLEAIKMI
jgi:histidinol-phosphate aminotransferase